MNIKRQTIFVGDVLESNNYGKYTVLEYIDSTDITIQFNDSGNIRKTTSSQIKRGNLKDRKIPKNPIVRVGSRFLTNYWGMCEVIEYRSGKKVLVKFDNSGTLKWTTSSQLNRGTVCEKERMPRIEVGKVYPTINCGSVTVLEILNRRRCIVRFSDGEEKEVSHHNVKVGNIMKGSWNYSQEEAIAKMTEVHKGFYCYSKVEFKTVKDKLTIICPNHGEFKMTFDNHVHGTEDGLPSGCRLCGIERRTKKKTLPPELFLEEAIKVKGEGSYSYFMEDYTTRENKIRMKCGTCESIFRQSPEKHLGGRGCPKCGKSGFKTTEDGVLYILSCGDLTKIGITNKTALARAKEISNSYGEAFCVSAEFKMKGDDCLELETFLLKKFRQDYRQPDFKFDGFTECFYALPVEHVVDCINSRCNTYYI